MHVLDRLKERYGLECSEADLDAAQAAILAGRSINSRRFGYTERHYVKIKGVMCHVAVSSVSKRLITALPKTGPGNKPKKLRPAKRGTPHGAKARRKREGARPAEPFDARLHR